MKLNVRYVVELFLGEPKVSTALQEQWKPVAGFEVEGMAHAYVADRTFLTYRVICVDAPNIPLQRVPNQSHIPTQRSGSRK